MTLAPAGGLTLLCLAALLAGVGPVTLAPSAAATTGAASFWGPILVVSTSDAGTKANDDNADPDLSANGRRVAFHSDATNLDPSDTDGVRDVYAKDTVSGDLVLVSTADDGVKGNDASEHATMSGTGTAVGFDSRATNLDPGDGDAEGDVYVKELATGDLTLVSTSDTGVKGNQYSGYPSLDRSGNRVAFGSTATNLDPADTDPREDVYVKTIRSGDLRLASVTAAGTKADSTCRDADLAASGNRVAFECAAHNLDPRDTDSYWDIYVKDLVTGDLMLASISASGVKFTDDSWDASLSGDGRRVAFRLRYGGIYVKDLTTGTLVLVSTSDDGVAGNGFDYGDPVISGDGRRVAFDTTSSNLDPLDTDRGSDVYVKDLVTGDIALASVSAEGVTSGGGSSSPSMSRDGRRVAFESSSSRLVPADPDISPDIYLAQPVMCTQVGTAGADVLVGTTGNDVLCGRGGDDTLIGGAGDDVLLGEDGSDVLEGGPGADAMDGGDGPGTDALSYVDSTLGVVVDLRLGTGSGAHAEGDVFVGIEDITGSEYDDSLFGDDGPNLLAGGDGDDVLAGVGGDDVLDGGRDDDSLSGGAGADTLTGGPAGTAGIDTLTYGESPAAVTVNLAGRTASGGSADGDTFSEIDSVVGSPYDDTLTGDNAANTLVGGAGADTLVGLNGDDILRGGTGVDTFHGGGGIDSCDAVPGEVAILCET